MKEKAYLSLNYRHGGFYESSKEPKQGFVEHTTSKGNVVYRKEYNFVEGVFKHTGLRTRGLWTIYTITLEDDFTIYEVQINLTDSRGNFDDQFLGDFINRLPYIEVGDNIRINPYNFTPKGEQYPVKGIAVRNKGIKLESAYKFSYYPKGSDRLVEGDIPPKIWVKNKLTGKSTIDPASQAKINEFYENLILKEQERVGFEAVTGLSKGGGVPMVKEAHTPTTANENPVGSVAPQPSEPLEPSKPVEEEDWESDLPF